MGDFKTLIVWQKARLLVKDVYQIARCLPVEERFDLAPQMRRAVKSISLNIAEGSGRFGARDQLRMFQIAMGSAREVEAQIIHACDVGYIDEAKAESILPRAQEVQAMLAGLIRSKRDRLDDTEK